MSSDPKLYLQLVVKECNLPFLWSEKNVYHKTYITFKGIEDLEQNWSQTNKLIQWNKFTHVEFSVYDIDLLEFQSHPLINEILSKIHSIDIRLHPYGNGNIFQDEVHTILQQKIKEHVGIYEITSPSLHPLDACKIMNWVDFNIQSINLIIHIQDNVFYVNILTKSLLNCKVKDIMLIFWDSDLREYVNVSKLNAKRLEFLESDRYAKYILLFKSKLFCIDEKIQVAQFITE